MTARDNLDIMARALAENMWRRRREIGARSSLRYGPHPAWESIDPLDRADWRKHAKLILLAIRAAGPGLDDATVALLIARNLYAQIWADQVASGSPHPGLGSTPTWERERPDHRGDYLSIARGVIHDVRAARIAAATPQVLASAA